MKRIINALLVATLAVSFAGIAAPAGAVDEDCNSEISNTGPDSNNEVTCTETNTVIVTCVNGIYVVNDNDQNSESGNGSVEDNTTGGSASTGTATNENGQTVQIGASCGAAAQATSGTQTTVPTGNGATTSTPQVLAATAGNSAVEVASVAALALGGIVALASVAVAAYRRIALR